MECKNIRGIAKKWDVYPFQIKNRAKIPNRLRKKSNKPLRSSFSVMGRSMDNDRLENFGMFKYYFGNFQSERMKNAFLRCGYVH